MGTIDIYTLNLCDFTPNSCCIDSATTRKAATYKSAKKRQEYLASEWLRRFVLKRYVDANEIVFDISNKGRPFLKNNSDYDFNISHTKDWIIMAVAKGQKIGIDIQSSRESIDALGIAKQYYAQSEYQWLSTLPASKINYYFYLLWTLKEASLKRTGEGIAFGLAHYAFIYKDKKLQLSNTVTTERPYYYSKDIASDILLSLAATQPIVKIRHFTIKNNSLLSSVITPANITSNNLIHHLEQSFSQAFVQ